MKNQNVNNNIVCSNCGTHNIANTKFCIRCGSAIQNQNGVINNELGNQVNSSLQVESNSIPNQTMNGPIMPSNSTNQQMNTQQMPSNQINRPMEAPQSSNIKTNQSNVVKMNYFKYILDTILKPYDTFKKEESNLSDIKKSGILLAIIAIGLTILNLISTMISSVRVTSFWNGKTEWVWENLKNVEYFKVIGQNLLMYVGIIAAISGVYYLASLVMKKDAKFVKLLSVTTTAFIPFAIASSILSPILSLISASLGLVITVVGFVYSLIILLELLNDLVVIEDKNTRIYFHLICLSILLVGGGFIAYKLVLGSLIGGLGSLLG